MAEYMQSYLNPQWKHDVAVNMDRLGVLVQMLETGDMITEDNPAFDDMCDFFAELQQVYWNLQSLMPK